MDNILFKRKDKTAYITINRPEVLNCFDYQTLKDLEDIIQKIYVDKEIQTVIITGAGEKAFSAGADLKERKTLNDKEVRRNVRKISDVFNQVAELPQPTIAAINGHAFGGGFELALACDFRFASSNAKMGLTETSMGIIPGAGGTQRLPRLIGTSKAMELILTAKRLGADEAFQYGIVSQVVDQSQLIAVSEELAKKMMKNAPIAVKQAKFAIRNGTNTDIKTGLQIEEKAYELIIPTKDRIEALEAFNEKRPPEFIGE
ncbi:enoyl-CoA hydratase-related protein [Oceanobacillus sp. J11TS1]|uniref:enoyl-CoA hydratase-related protein n=1 Tax=Oceanobacillus sp. J11TS1 TaxID=2807191 RepID=UPI001B28FD82|nr:enoyl-CoA hydratase-related protein [Oceanobacillus sp. J11TS1]GIO23623.1 putative enoyl-CoA hydratase/isomerase YngF [Oceanobacillus sp. J11TS1]